MQDVLPWIFFICNNPTTGATNTTAIGHRWIDFRDQKLLKKDEENDKKLNIYCVGVVIATRLDIILVTTVEALMAFSIETYLDNI